jgi:hypothetical protein
MISQKLNINQVEYIVRAKNKAELDKAVQFLYECNEHQMAQLEEGLNKDFDQLLQDVEAGKVVLESRIEGEEEVKAEPAIEKVVKPVAPKRSNAPKTPKAPSAPKGDNKTVNLGGMGKQG